MNIIDQFKNATADTLIRQYSGQFGESAQSISTSLGAIVPAILGAMMLKGNTDKGARGLLDFISGNDLENLTIEKTGLDEEAGGTEQLMSKGSEALKYLVGDNITSMVDLISAEAGLKTSSASSMLKVVAPLVMGFVGRLVKEKSMNASGLKDLLLSQSSFIKDSTPKGLNELLGLSMPAGTDIPPASPSDTSGKNTSTSKSGMSKFLPWLVLGLASLGLFYFLQKGCNPPPPKTESTQVMEQPVPETPLPSAATPPGSEDQAGGLSTQAPIPTGPSKFKLYQLPDGGKLAAEPNTFTSLMIEYVQGKEKAGKCIPFNAVFFDAGSDKLNMLSDAQLYELLLILNAYPKMTVLFKGSSEAKAKTVFDWFTFRNISRNRLQTEVISSQPGANKDQIEVCVVKKG